MKNTQKAITRTIEGKHIVVAHVTVHDGVPKLSTETITQIEGWPKIPVEATVVSEIPFTEVCTMPISFFYHNSERTVKQEEPKTESEN